jgi:DNA polymerase III psi subunit
VAEAQVNLLFRGRHAQERQDLVLDDGTHLRLRSGDIIALSPEQATSIMGQRPYRYWFTPTDAPARLAVDATDVAHDASAPATGGVG